MSSIKKALSTAYTRNFDGDIESIRRIYDLFEKGLKEAKNNTGTKSEGVAKLSLQSYKDNVDLVMENKYHSDNLVHIGSMPYRLHDILGAPRLPMYISPKHIYTMAVSEQQAKREGRFDKNSHYHDLGVDFLKRLPDVLDKPQMIIKSNTDKTDATFIVVTNEVDNKGNPIIAAIKPMGNARYFDINFISPILLSGYGKDNFNSYFNKAYNENRILYVFENKKSSRNNNFKGRFQSPTIKVSSNYLNNNLAQFKKVVNSNIRQNSLKDTQKFSLTDSEGNNLTQEQAEYFKDSKARDENGDLLVMYHGTVNDFTVFDRTKGNAEGDFGKGFYLTNSLSDVEKNYANKDGVDLKSKIAKYAERLEMNDEYEDMDYEELEKIAQKKFITADPTVITAYVDIKNPVIIDNRSGKETYFDIEYAYDEELDDYDYDEVSGKLFEFVEALENNLDEFYSYGDVSFWEALTEFPNGGYVSDVVKALKNNILEEVTNEDGDLAVNELIRMAFEDMGYDGIIDTTVSEKFKNMGLSSDTIHAIAFNSNQIKRTDNLQPTENDDIRFSLKSVDDFDRNEYNNIRISAREYNRVHSEIMTNFPNVKNTVNSITLASAEIEYYYVMDDNYNITILNEVPIETVEEREAIDNEFDTNTERFDINVGINRSGERNRTLSNESSKNRGIAKSNDELNRGSLRSEGQSNEKRVIENGNNSDSSEKSGSFSLKNADKIAKKIKKTQSEDKLIEYLAQTFSQQTSVEYDRKAINKFAKDFVKKNSSTYKASDLAYNLELILKNSKNIEAEEMVGLVANAFEPVYENSEIADDSFVAEYGELKKMLRTTRVTLNDMQKAELRSYLGSNWRQQLFGKINLKKSGVSLDSFYQELSGSYPEFFDADLNSNEQALKILDVLDALQPEVYNPFEFKNRHRILAVR